MLRWSLQLPGAAASHGCFHPVGCSCRQQNRPWSQVNCAQQCHTNIYTLYSTAGSARPSQLDKYNHRGGTDLQQRLRLHACAPLSAVVCVPRGTCSVHGSLTADAQPTADTSLCVEGPQHAGGLDVCSTRHSQRQPECALLALRLARLCHAQPLRSCCRRVVNHRDYAHTQLDKISADA
jgi:hypothetical protein